MQNFEWIKCPNCTHKLLMLRYVRSNDNVALSIKCPSCKKIVEAAVVNGSIMTAVIADDAVVFAKEVRAADEN